VTARQAGNFSSLPCSINIVPTQITAFIVTQGDTCGTIDMTGISSDARGTYKHTGVSCFTNKSSTCSF
jgi:hypothetical protein